jgi:DNA-binding MarR family transcriptional regulator
MMEDKRLFIRNCARIVKKAYAHMDTVLKDYGLSRGSYPYLLELRGNEGIHGEDLSKILGVDKAMSARTIKKLVQSGYITKIPDEADSRASKLYLTEKARSCIPIILSGIDQWVDFIIEDLDEAEKNSVFRLLTEIENKTNSEG